MKKIQKALILAGVLSFAAEASFAHREERNGSTPKEMQEGAYTGTTSGFFSSPCELKIWKEVILPGHVFRRYDPKKDNVNRYPKNTIFEVSGSDHSDIFSASYHFMPSQIASRTIKAVQGGGDYNPNHVTFELRLDEKYEPISYEVVSHTRTFGILWSSTLLSCNLKNDEIYDN